MHLLAHKSVSLHVLVQWAKGHVTLWNQLQKESIFVLFGAVDKQDFMYIPDC